MIWRQLTAGRLDVPLAGDDSGRFLPWIVALTIYLSGIGGLGLILLGDTLREWDRELSSTLTLQVPANVSAARLETTLALLRGTPGIGAAHPLTSADAARLLEPWLGDSLPIDSLPLPRLIDLRVDPDAAIDVAKLRRHLASVVPGAQLDDHWLWLDRLRRFALRVETVIAAVVATLAAITVLTVIFTARTGLAIHHPVIEILHLLGARDSYIAGQFQLHCLRLGVYGGALGAVAAAITLLLLSRAAAALELPLRIAPHGLVDWRVWTLLLILPLAAGGVALVTARVTVLRRLANLP